MSSKRLLKSNWISSYAEAVAPISQSPSQFHIWAAISMIGAIAKNNVSIDRATYTIYPNTYVVLTGPPGTGKGEALRYVYAFAERLKLINSISDRVTAEKILKRLADGFPGLPQIQNGGIVIAKDSSATLVSTELQTLITSSDWMLALLCDLWDKNKFEYDTKNSGSAFIENMCVSLIGACVPNLIARLNKDRKDINDGFTARTIFVFADRSTKKITWPEPLDKSQKGKKIIADLEHDLSVISHIKGSMTFSPMGRIALEQFHKKLNIDDDDSEILVNFKSRLLTHVLKTSMIFSLSERDTLEITDRDIQNAATCLKHVELNLEKAFRAVGDSDLAEATAKVQLILERRGGISKSELMGQLIKDMSPETLDRVLNMLMSIDYLGISSGSANGNPYFILKKPAVAPPITTAQTLKSVLSSNPKLNN